MKNFILLIFIFIVGCATPYSENTPREILSDITLTQNSLLVKRCRAYTHLNEVRTYKCVSEQINLKGF